MTQPSFQAFIQSHLDVEEAPALNAILCDIAEACIKIASAIDTGALMGNMDSLDSSNVQGETQKALDVISNDLFIDTIQQSGFVAGVASEEMDDILLTNSDASLANQYLLLFDPLDGSSNVNVNISVGSIFSVLKAPNRTPVLADFLQSGTAQVCAGYALYGTSTMLVLTIGKGVNGFTLDKASGTFYLTHPNMQIPKQTQEFAVNVSNYRFWQSPIQRYVDECLLGKEGERGKDFNMRWVASMVAEVHRILMRGGLFMYPQDSKPQTQQGKLRLLYEANPMSFIVEQAGGAASTGSQRILELTPTQLHQRVPVILGSLDEVLRLETYHLTAED
jgi:fructose-1,6-bisphosphatase I